MSRLKRIRNDANVHGKFRVPKAFVEEVRRLKSEANSVLAASTLEDLHYLRGRVLALEEILGMVVEE